MDSNHDQYDGLTRRHGLVESRMPRNGHVRFGGRAAETDPAKTGHRAAARPDTYVPITAGGFAYTAFVTGAFSKMITGWKVAAHVRASLALDALEMAVSARLRTGQQVAGVIHHGDRGGQYLAIRYTGRLAEAGAIASVGSKGDSYDNALTETIIGLYKAELIRHRGPWHSVALAGAATAWWVGWSSNRRLYRPLGDIPPAEYEQNWLKGQQP